jgi:hypothetical protein
VSHSSPWQGLPASLVAHVDPEGALLALGTAQMPSQMARMSVVDLAQSTAVSRSWPGKAPYVCQ